MQLHGIFRGNRSQQVAAIELNWTLGIPMNVTSTANPNCSNVIAALLALVLPAEQRELIPRLTGMVFGCKGVAEHRGKLWGDLSESEGNVVVTRVGVIAHEIIRIGR